MGPVHDQPASTLDIQAASGMFRDDLIRRWRGDGRQLGRRMLVGAAGYVAVAPSRPRRSRATLAMLIVAIGILLALAVETGRI
jgi:hypothetical protein